MMWCVHCNHGNVVTSYYPYHECIGPAGHTIDPQGPAGHTIDPQGPAGHTIDRRGPTDHTIDPWQGPTGHTIHPPGTSVGVRPHPLW